jgi:hypothetical protein
VSRPSILLAVLAGAAGLLLGRALPGRSGQTVAVAAPPPLAVATRSCPPSGAQLASLRAQLALCLAYAPAAAPTAPAKGLVAFAEAHAADLAAWQEAVDRLPEAVFVRRKDGTSAVYAPDEVSPEREDVYARKLPDGHIVYYAGPEAGPRSDLGAWVRLRDLAGADGTIPLAPGPTTLRFLPREEAQDQ